MRHDVTVALRRLRGSPGFAVAAVVSLGVGIGAVATVCGIINALLLRPVPAADTASLLSVYERRGELQWRSVSYREWEAYAQAKTLVGSAAFTGPGLELSVRAPDEHAVRTAVTFVTPGYFALLGVRPVAGHAFDEGTPADVTRAVVSHSFWRTRLGARSDALGSVLYVSGRPVEVAGVAPAAFGGTFTGFAADLWLPLTAFEELAHTGDSLRDRDSHFLYMLARARGGATATAVAAQLDAIGAGLIESGTVPHGELSTSVVPATGLLPFVRQAIGGFLAILLLGALLVLAVAVTNLAGLLVARATARRGELAIRAALGASRALLVRAVLIEAVLLAGAGLLLGLVLAELARSGLQALVPPLGLSFVLDLSTDLRVIALGAVLALVACVAAGLPPAWRAARMAQAPTLREDAVARAGRVRRVLLTAQVAVSVVLIAGGMVLARGLQRAAGLEPGFAPEHVAVVPLDAALLGYDGARLRQLYDDLRERARALEGATHAGIALYTPLGPVSDRVPVVVAGSTDTVPTSYNAISPGLLETLGVPLLRGRDVASSDHGTAPAVALVSAAFARRHWPDRDALGARFDVRGTLVEVIGVTADVTQRVPGEAARPFIYFALAQADLLRRPDIGAVLHVRAAAAPERLLPALRTLVRAADADLPARPELLRDVIRFATFPARVAAALIGGCAVLTLVLAGIGVYGVAAHAAVQRRREVAIRLALGARPRQAITPVLRDGLTGVAVGLGVGVPLALLATRALGSLLFGMPPSDPASHALAAGVLIAAVALAMGGPSRAAARSSALLALRE